MKHKGYIIMVLLRIYRYITDYKDKFLVWTMFSIVVSLILQSMEIDIMNFRFVWFIFAWIVAMEGIFLNTKGRKWKIKNAN